MNQKISLSYVMTTFNKLPYLKVTLSQLLDALQPDEEIVIVDGSSTDGTVEYLQELYKDGRIQQFVSEPDKGEAHGTNKGLLLARGKLIKIITDDDAFYWPAIQKCKEFMLEHSDVDILGTEGSGTDWSLSNPFGTSIYYVDYEKWLSKFHPFSFCGLGLMIRRNSLPVLGLFHTSFIRVDHEFTLRVTSSPVNIAWFTGCTWVRMINPQSISARNGQRMEEEGFIVNQFYLPGEIQKQQKYKNLFSISDIKIGNTFLNILRKVFRKVFPKPNVESSMLHHENDQWDAKMELSNNWLSEYNERFPGSFLFR